MIWSAKAIRELRKRLGWTQSDMARRIGCNFEDVANLEKGKAFAGKEILLQLGKLQRHLEQSSRRKAREPMAEKFMEDRGLSQITSEDIDKLHQEE